MIPDLIQAQTNDVAITLYGPADNVARALSTLNAVTGLSVAAATDISINDEDERITVMAELRFVPTGSVETGELLVS